MNGLYRNIQMFTYPFSTSIYIRDQMAPWAIKSTENLPTPTST